jgi:hypothetical protein
VGFVVSTLENVLIQVLKEGDGLRFLFALGDGAGMSAGTGTTLL